jgi:hypothetical protein
LKSKKRKALVAYPLFQNSSFVEEVCEIIAFQRWKQKAQNFPHRKSIGGVDFCP